MKNKTHTFIEKAKSIHGDKYDYSKTVYHKAHDKLTIICPTHGEFCCAAHSHTSRKSGCPHCAGRARKTTEQFITEASNLHNSFYSYERTDYKNINTKVTITCPIHGDFNQTPKAHTILKQGCPKCVPEKLKQHGRKRALTTEQFISEAIKIHGDKYDYSLVNYTTTHNKVTIICPEHGEFNQTPNQHVSATHGCPKCSNLLKAGIGGYTLKRFENDTNLSSSPGVFYVVDFVGLKEHFYKIGISKNSVAHRFYISNKMGMKVTILQEHYMSLLDAFNLEQQLLETLIEYKYWPNSRIGGFTECFKPKQEVLDVIAEAANK